MNFLSFLSSGAKMLNFNLNSTDITGFNFFQPKLSAAINNQAGFKEIQPKELQGQPSKLQISSNIVEARNPEKIVKSLQKKQLLEEILLNQQQQLINQYLQLNLELMNKKCEEQNLEKNYAEKNQNQSDQVKCQKKKIKKMNRCGHDDKEHYAKGMCNNCYHKFGRTKKPWNCSHEKLYASGMCQNCYINRYNKNRRMKQTQKVGDSQISQNEI